MQDSIFFHMWVQKLFINFWPFLNAYIFELSYKKLILKSIELSLKWPNSKTEHKIIDFLAIAELKEKRRLE